VCWWVGVWVGCVVGGGEVGGGGGGGGGRLYKLAAMRMYCDTS